MVLLPGRGVKLGVVWVRINGGGLSNGAPVMVGRGGISSALPFRAVVGKLSAPLRSPAAVEGRTFVATDLDLCLELAVDARL